RDPGVACIAMDIFVPIDTEDRRQHGNDENTHWSANRSSTHGCYELTTHDHVDSRPTSACCNVEEGHDPCTHPTERETRNRHLPQTQPGTHSREEGDREHPKNVEENDSNYTIPKSEFEDGRRECAKRKSGNY